MLAESSDAVQITTMITSALVVITTGVLAYLTLKLNRRADEAKVAAVEVKDSLVATASVLDDRLQGIADTGDSTHKFVNSAMGNVLRMLAEVSRAKAKDSGSAVDLAAADAAEKAYAAHQAAQMEADVPREKFKGDETMRVALEKLLRPHASTVRHLPEK
jgi:hypothetical protein